MQDEKDLLKMRTVIGNNQIFPGAYLVLMQVVHPADFIHIILQRIVMPVRITQGNGCKRVARINQDTGKILVTDRGTFLPGVRKKAKSKNTEKTGNTNCRQDRCNSESKLAAASVIRVGKGSAKARFYCTIQSEILQEGGAIP